MPDNYMIESALEAEAEETEGRNLMFDKYRTAKQAMEIIEGTWLGFMIGGGLAAVTVAHKSWLGLAVIAVIAIVLTASMFHWRATVKILWRAAHL